MITYSGRKLLIKLATDFILKPKPRILYVYLLGSGIMRYSTNAGLFFGKNLRPYNHQRCIAAYQVVLALMQNFQSETAVKCLEDISQQCGDNLPFTAKFPNVRFLLDDTIVGEALPDLVRGKDYLELLELCVEEMDRRLGIQWSPKNQSHFSTALDLSASIWEASGDQLLPKIDKKKSVVSDHAGHLYAEIYAHGCSKSLATLGKIVDLLNDHDRQAHKIVTHLDYNIARLDEFRSKIESLELRWVPEHTYRLNFLIPKSRRCVIHPRL